MSESAISKRLHISGLTPAITHSDIAARLRRFGNVVALDGFGALDALGQPRKFAYVTLEATESNLTRCLNVLSGTTWKGAKLRVGEAKPDYIQRLDAERKAAKEGTTDRPSKRRRLRGVQGVHSSDMSVVNLQNVDNHSGWYTTALSHLIRPMKMRPSRPLPTPMSNTRDKPETSNGKKPRKSKLIDPQTHARIRIIDPRLYRPVHLRENMLNEMVVDTQAIKPPPVSPPSSPDNENSFLTPSRDPSLSSNSSQAEFDVDPALDREEEKQRDLKLLKAIFQSGDSSREVSLEHAETNAKTVAPESEEGESPGSTKDNQPTAARNISTEKSQMTSLKNMFKPHEEVGFSLLPGLGEIDIDPDIDLDFTSAPHVEPERVQLQQEVAHILPSDPSTSLTLNPSLPFFFPQPDNPRAKDLFTIARAEGWEFGRTGDSDTIRQRWDAVKGTLTKEWKKRSREAVKARKRRYGAVEGEEV